MSSLAVPFIEKAAPFIAFGIPVIPLMPKDKMPPLSMKGWQKERKFTTDPAVVAAWNTECSDYNVGLVAMGEEDGFCFLEFDGSPGLKKICAQLGQEYPNTRIHRSGRGGGHYIFKHTPKSLSLGNRSAAKDGIEWLASGRTASTLLGQAAFIRTGRCTRLSATTSLSRFPIGSAISSRRTRKSSRDSRRVKPCQLLMTSTLTIGATTTRKSSR